MVRRASGSPSTGAAALARASVSGCRRVPRPAVRTSARTLLGSPEHHVGAVEPGFLLVLQEQRAVGVYDVVGRPPSEGARHGGDARFAALDLDEHADRRLVDGDDDVLVREFLAVLLVAEPDVEAQFLEDPQQQPAVADHRLELVADLHLARLHRSLEGDPALAVLDADPEHAAPPPQRLVL